MRIFEFFFLFFAISIIPVQLSSAQVSHPSGFYSGIDSLLFEILWEIEDYEKLEISVNHSSYIDYTKGVYLKDLSYTDNDWENEHLYRGDKNGGSKVTFNGKTANNLKVLGKHEGNYDLFVNLELLKVVQHKLTFAIKVYINNDLTYSGDIVINKKDNVIFDSNIGWSIICDDYSHFKNGDKWDIQFSTNRTYYYAVDFNAERGKIRKVNTVKVRSIDTRNGAITRDSVYIIGLFNYPYEHHTLFVTVDNKDVIRVLNDFGDISIKTDAYIHIFSPHGKLEYQGQIKMEKAAGSSRYLPNHGWSFNSIKNQYIGTTLFGGKIEDIDKIKFRVGGNDQSKCFSCHEIVLNVLAQTPQLKMIGGVKNSVAVLYLNGSYWSMGFPQQKANKFFYKNLFEVKSKDVDVFSISPFVFSVDSIVEKIQGKNKGTLIYPAMELQKRLGMQSEIFSNKNIDKFILNRNAKESGSRIEGVLKDGDIERVTKKIEQYYRKELSIEELIDIDLWSAYLAIIHFGSMSDIVSHNNNIAMINDELLFPILLDFDSFGSKSINDNIFDLMFDEYIAGEENLFKNIIRDFRNSEFAMNRFFSIYQELLNTSLYSKKTVPIIERYEREVMKLYDEMYHSWGGFPNGGVEPQKQKELYIKLKEFYEKRPEICYVFLNELMTKIYQNQLQEAELSN